MQRFFDELAEEARRTPAPTLAQRSLAMARDIAQQQAKRDQEGLAMLELRQDAQPPEPLSLDLYLDAMVRKLNRSAAMVRNDPHSQGVRSAALQFRIQADGRLKSFTLLNVADQGEEIAFIRSVIERALPFAAFPPDLAKAVRSLGITICIEPGGSGGFGFTRLPDNRSC